MDAAVRPCEEFANVWTFVIGGIVPNHMDEALVGIAGLDPGQKPGSADPVHGGRLNKGRIEGFKVERAMDIHAPAPCGSRHGGI